MMEYAIDMFAVDEIRLLTGQSFDIGVGLTLRQPSMREIAMSGENEYIAAVNAFTAEPFDVPYYLAQLDIDFEKVTPFQLFGLLVLSLPHQSTKLLFGDLDFSKFLLVESENKGEYVYAHPNGIIIDSLTRERIADNIRRMHGLPKNILKSCENKTAHDLMIYQQKKEIARAQRRRELFGEQSAYGSLISSLASEWHSYDGVLDLKVGQFFDAVIRLGYKRQADNLCRGIYNGNISLKDINKKDLDWMRPIKTKTL